MPIVDISGLSAKENDAKIRIRKRIQVLYHDFFGIREDATTVTFIPDDTAEGLSVPCFARLYSIRFTGMGIEKLDALGDAVADAMREEAGHALNEAFVVPVLNMRSGTK